MNDNPKENAMIKGFHTATFLALTLAGFAVSAPKDVINVLPAYEEAQGFQLLFDSTANSFRNNFADYTQNNTTSTTLNAGWTMDTTFTDPDHPGTFFRSIKTTAALKDIRTRRIFKDFDLRMEYRNDGNQGIIYRFDVTQSTSWATGVEFAIDDNSNQGVNWTTGAVYDMIGPTPPATQSYYGFTTGKWNTLRVVARGDSVEHWINGYKVASFRYWQGAFLAAYPNSKWTGYNRFCQTAANNRTYIPQGYLGLQADHSGHWQIRKMRVLNDSLSTQTRVKLGPVDTTGVAGIFSSRSEKAFGYRIDRLSRGLRISTEPGNLLRSVELLGMDGRLIRRVRPSAGSNELVLDEGGLHKGIYILRLETSSGIHQGKTLIQ